MFKKIFFKNKYIFPVFIGYITNNYLNENSVHALTYCSTKSRIRGEYENKIRMYSTPEKIFETFATIKKDNGLYMSYFDLFKSICPFNYSDKERKSDDNKSIESGALIKLIDADKDGIISIYEYMFLVSFLQLHKNEILHYFKEKFPGGKMNKEEFKTFMEFMREKSKIKLTLTGPLLDPRGIKLSKEKYEENLNEISNKLFLSNETISTNYIIELKKELLNEVYQFEFNSFNTNENNEISQEDFAKSIVCFLEVNKVPFYMKHLEKIKFNDKNISFQNYSDFHYFFLENYDKLEKEIKNKGVLSKNRLKKIIGHFCEKNKTFISEDQINIFVQILDLNSNNLKIIIKILDDNRIDTKEFLGVLQNRSFYGISDIDSLRKPFFSVWDFLNKSYDKFERIWQIVKE